MNTHVKILALLHIVHSALALAGALVIFAVFGLTGGLVFTHGEAGAASLVAVLGLLIGSLFLVVSLPGIIGGWGLLAGKSWARVLLIVVGIFDLLHFPIGTALGVYTLWVLLREEPLQPAGFAGMHPPA